MILDRKEIEKLLPHRSPFLFLDKVEILEKFKKGLGFKKFLPNEYFFKGHFPDKPIVPGVILIEALAQTAGTIISHSLTTITDRSVLFMSVSKAKFRKPVLPNDEISIEVNLLNQIKTVYKFYGTASVQSIKVCEAEFSAMITNKANTEIL